MSLFSFVLLAILSILVLVGSILFTIYSRPSHTAVQISTGTTNTSINPATTASIAFASINSKSGDLNYDIFSNKLTISSSGYYYFNLVTSVDATSTYPIIDSFSLQLFSKDSGNLLDSLTGSNNALTSTTFPLKSSTSNIVYLSTGSYSFESPSLTRGGVVFNNDGTGPLIVANATLTISLISLTRL